MKAHKINLSQEFEKLLDGRSILDLTGEEAAKSSDLLTEIVRTKPLKSLTKVELQALVEKLLEILSMNMFKGDLPENCKEQVLYSLKTCYERDSELSFVSILDFYLYNVKIWNVLDAEDKEVIAKTIVKHLEGENYYDYLMGYVEDYLDDEEEQTDMI